MQFPDDENKARYQLEHGEYCEMLPKKRLKPTVNIVAASVERQAAPIMLAVEVSAKLIQRTDSL